MELRHLRYFAEVVANGTFRGAAKKLRVSQPALSKQVQEMEDELGVCLLVRKATGVQLTAAGREFYVRAKKAVDSLESAVQRVRSVDAQGTATLRVGVHGTFLSHLLPRAVEEFTAKSPGANIEIREMCTEDLLVALRSGELTVGISAVPLGRMPQGIERRVLTTLQFGLAMHRSHPASRKQRIALSEVADSTFLCFAKGRKFDDHLQRTRDIFDHFNLPPPHVKCVDDYYGLYVHMASRDGITLVPRLPSWFDGFGMVMRPLKDAGAVLDFPIGALWSDRYLDGPGEEFVRIAGQVLRKL